MTLKIPTSLYGIDGKEAYDRIVNKKEEQKPTPTTPIIKPTGDLSFVIDKKMYEEIFDYLNKTFPAHKEVLSGKLSFDNVMKGSNPYISVGVDMFLKKQNLGYRTATQRDLETNLEMFKEAYEDTGLALRSISEPNKSQADYLYNQIRKSNPKLKFPIFVELRDLELDSNLNFNLTQESRYKIADCLNWENGTNFSQTDDFGLPKEKDKNSSRQIWTMKNGLVRLCLNRNLDLYSNIVNLSNSNDIGRVVLAKSR